MSKCSKYLPISFHQPLSRTPHNSYLQQVSQYHFWEGSELLGRYSRSRQGKLGLVYALMRTTSVLKKAFTGELHTASVTAPFLGKIVASWLNSKGRQGKLEFVYALMRVTSLLKKAFTGKCYRDRKR